MGKLKSFHVLLTRTSFICTAHQISQISMHILTGSGHGFGLEVCGFGYINPTLFPQKKKITKESRKRDIFFFFHLQMTTNSNSITLLFTSWTSTVPQPHLHRSSSSSLINHMTCGTFWQTFHLCNLMWLNKIKGLLFVVGSNTHLMIFDRI